MTHPFVAMMKQTWQPFPYQVEDHSMNQAKQELEVRLKYTTNVKSD